MMRMMMKQEKIIKIEVIISIIFHIYIYMCVCVCVYRKIDKKVIQVEGEIY